MYCLRWWIPLFLFPFPKTTPLFLILFLISFAIHSKPCMYCALIIVGLITTSSNWYTTPTANKVTSHEDTASLSSAEYTEGVRLSNGWFDFGLSGGPGFWQPIARPSDIVKSESAPRSAHFRVPIPWSQHTVHLPKCFYVGLGKHDGMGVWVNLLSDSACSLSPDEVSSEAPRAIPSKRTQKVEL